MNGTKTEDTSAVIQAGVVHSWVQSFATVSDLLWVSNAEAKVGFTNRAMSDFLVSRPGTDTTARLQACIPPGSVSTIKGLLAKAALNGQAQCQLALIKPSHERALFDVTTYRLGTADAGQGFAWIAREVQQAKTSNLESHRSNVFLETLMEHVIDRIYFKDTQSRFVGYNRNFQRAHQLPAIDAFSGKADSDLFTYTLAREAFEDEQRILRSGVPVMEKLQMETHPDGRVSWTLTSKMPWRDADGRLLGTFGISRDVTQLKEAEAQLQAAHNSLLDASRIAGLEEVATEVLHHVDDELKSLNNSCSRLQDQLGHSKLTTLSLWSDSRRLGAAGLKDPRTDPTQEQQIPDSPEELAGPLVQEHEFLTREIEQLKERILQLKEIVVKQQQCCATISGSVESVSLTQLVEDVLHINTPAFARHGIQIQREFVQLPKIQTIKQKVLRILLSLIHNATCSVKAAGGVGRWIRITLATAGPGAVVVRIANNGAGFRPEHLSKMLEPGFVAWNDGHGFGLQASAAAARELAGTLEGIADGPGQGSTISLRLPVMFQPPRL